MFHLHVICRPASSGKSFLLNIARIYKQFIGQRTIAAFHAEEGNPAFILRSKPAQAGLAYLFTLSKAQLSGCAFSVGTRLMLAPKIP